jgi:hypothetical protein
MLLSSGCDARTGMGGGGGGKKVNNDGRRNQSLNVIETRTFTLQQMHCFHEYN